MGNPHIYYKRALQYFAHSLAYMEDEKLAEELFEETSDVKLINFILHKKMIMEEKSFYYEAGRVSQCVLYEAYKESNDAFNASFDGIESFEHFIGIDEE